MGEFDRQFDRQQDLPPAGQYPPPASEFDLIAAMQVGGAPSEGQGDVRDDPPIVAPPGRGETSSVGGPEDSAEGGTPDKASQVESPATPAQLVLPRLALDALGPQSADADKLLEQANAGYRDQDVEVAAEAGVVLGRVFGQEAPETRAPSEAAQGPADPATHETSPPQDIELAPLQPVGRPDELHVYPVTAPDESSFAGKKLEVFCEGKTLSTDVTYPSKITIRNGSTGDVEIRGEASTHRVPGRPPLDHSPQSSYFDGTDLSLRSYSFPPDEMRIDEMPADPAQASDAIVALLEGYITDATQRLTTINPKDPSKLRFKPEAALALKGVWRNGWSFSEEELRDALIGEPIGISYVLLNDYATNEAVARNDTVRTPQMEAVGNALSRFDCDVLTSWPVKVDSERHTGILLLLTRREDDDA